MKLKKVLAFLLAVTMIISVTGCAQKSNNNSKSAQDGKVQNENPQDKLGKYAQPVVLTTVRATNSNIKFPQGDDYNNNVYTRLIKEKLNIEIKYEWVVDNTQWQTKYATMLTSGSLPDFFSADPLSFQQLTEDDAVMDITKMYKNYETERMKKETDGFKEGFDSAFRNGKMYGIPYLGYGIMTTPDIFWIREDWLKEAGLEVPKTMDELEKTAAKFMEMKPGSCGMSLTKSLDATPMHSIKPFLNAYHAYSKIWIKKNGKLEYSSIQPEMKTALLKLQEWYKKGLIDKEFSVKDAAKVSQELAAGKVGIMGGQNWMGFNPLKNSIANDPKAQWMAIDVPKGDNKEVTLQGKFDVNAYRVVNKKCKNPEALMKMINLFYQISDSGQTLEYQKQVPDDAFPIYETETTANDATQVAMTKAFKTGDTSLLSKQSLLDFQRISTWEQDRNPVSYGRYLQYNPNRGSFRILKKYVDDKKILITGIHGADPSGYSSVRATLEKMEDDTFTKIIMGDDIGLFDKFVASWKKLGGDKATKDVNEMYNK